MSNHADVIAHIARLEGELQRIQRELDVLRAQVGAPSSGKARRTQTFTPLLGPSRQGAVNPRDPREAPTRELPAQSEARITRPERPESNAPVSSQPAPTTRSDRRMQAGRTGLTEYPVGGEGARKDSESGMERLSTGPRAALTDPQAGRYEYYEPASPRSEPKTTRKR